MTRDGEEFVVSTDDVHAFIECFWGFGAPEAWLWFVGPEPGGGADVAALQRSVNTWIHRGRLPFEHLQDFHRTSGDDQWFSFRQTGRAKLQRTWRRLIRTFFAASGRRPDNESVRQFQSRDFCGNDKDVACYELSALPARNKSAWPYKSEAVPHSIRDRRCYEAEHLPRRLEKLGNLLDEHKPKVVVFYSDADRYVKYWSDLSEEKPLQPYKEISGHPVLRGGRADTSLLVIRHPNWRSKARGVRDDYFDSVGEIIAGIVNSKEVGV